MKLFYVDLVRGDRIGLIAGPFASEAIARKYEKAAFRAAEEIDPFVAFDRFGVIAIPAKEYGKPGKVNHLIEIDPADLAPIEAQRAA